MSGTIDRTGTRFDFQIRLGVDTGMLQFEVTDDATGFPVDLTGYGWEGGVYHRADRDNVLTWNYDASAIADGVIGFYLTNEQNAGLATSGIDQQSAYVHWLNAITPAGEKCPLIFGDYLVIWGTGE